MTETTLTEIRVLIGAVEACPHETISLAKERVLRLLALAEEALRNRPQETKRPAGYVA